MAGKSTQSARLYENLLSKGIPVELMRFPDRTTVIGQRIDSYLRDPFDNLSDVEVHRLFALNRSEMKESMEVKLRNGSTLIVDRYAHSGVAYSVAKGLDMGWCKSFDADNLVPDLVIFLDAEVNVLQTREGFGDEKYETVKFAETVRQVYRTLMDPSWMEVDATQSPDDIHEQILNRSMSTLDRLSSSSSLPLTCFSQLGWCTK